jgi:hypothetical protein
MNELKTGGANLCTIGVQFKGNYNTKNNTDHSKAINKPMWRRTTHMKILQNW